MSAAISIIHEGSKVVVKIDTGLPIERNVAPFSWERGNEFDAVLLEKHLKGMLRNTMQAIRAEAYREGYKHGRSKLGKRDWFAGDLP